jgi:hypothetical protein
MDGTGDHMLSEISQAQKDKGYMFSPPVEVNLKDT